MDIALVLIQLNDRSTRGSDGVASKSNLFGEFFNRSEINMARLEVGLLDHSFPVTKNTTRTIGGLASLDEYVVPTSSSTYSVCLECDREQSSIIRTPLGQVNGQPGGSTGPVRPKCNHIGLKTVKQLPKCHLNSFGEEPAELAANLYSGLLSGRDCRRAVPVFSPRTPEGGYSVGTVSSLTSFFGRNSDRKRQYYQKQRYESGLPTISQNSPSPAPSISRNSDTGINFSTTSSNFDQQNVESPMAYPAVTAGVAPVIPDALFCAPILQSENVIATPDSLLRFYPLEQVLAFCKSSSSIIDIDTRHHLLKLEEWLRGRHKDQSSFLQCLFLRPPAADRLSTCVHNPAHLRESKSCVRRIPSPVLTQHPGVKRQSSVSLDESDLREEKRRANEISALQIMVEKCNSFVMNPLYGSGLPYRVTNGQQLVTYMAKGRAEPPSPKTQYSICQSESSDAGSWMDNFPLHKHSMSGNSDALAALLGQGWDPNAMDSDSWRPIHYAAWYGKLSSLGTLLNHSKCDINAQNQNHSTALHFAAYNGHSFMVELLLSDPDLDMTMKDREGKTALDLCEMNPRLDHQKCAVLLQAANEKVLEKITVETMDEATLMVLLPNGADTTAAQVHQLVCKELRLDSVSGRIFGLWLCSDSLQLQLKAEHVIVKHMQQWRKVVEKLAEPHAAAELPRLFFRRDAKLPLGVEKNILESKGASEVAMSLLYAEAHANYIKGFYPCKDADYAMLAAKILAILHRDIDPKKDRSWTSDKTLSRLIPFAKLHMKHSGRSWVDEIMSEYKKLKTKNLSMIQLQVSFLSMVRTLRVYGSAFFNAELFMLKRAKGRVLVTVGINDYGLHVINSETKNMFTSCSYKNLMWKYDGHDRPYIQVTTRGIDAYEFNLKTKQASVIDFLLKKMSDPKLAIPSSMAPAPSPTPSGNTNSSSSPLINRANLFKSRK